MLKEVASGISIPICWWCLVYGTFVVWYRQFIIHLWHCLEFGYTYRADSTLLYQTNQYDVPVWNHSFLQHTWSLCVLTSHGLSERNESSSRLELFSKIAFWKEKTKFAETRLTPIVFHLSNWFANGSVIPR